MRFCFLALALLTGLPAAVPAQSSPDSLAVPEAALRVLQIPIDTDRPVAMLRAIRLLHSLAKRDESSQTAIERIQQARELERRLGGLVAFRQGMQQADRAKHGHR